MQAIDLLKHLSARGLIAQDTGQDSLAKQLEEPTTFYLGLDPTGESLHVGHLTPLLLMRHLVAAGHRAIVVIGGGTALVGDPTGKSEARPMLSAEIIEANGRRVAAQAQQVLGGVGHDLITINNLLHFKGVEYIEFLRDIGRHFSVNRMLAAESVQQRLKTSLSFIEFNYQLLQAYDFLVLRRSHNCRLQIGGDDQWGNMLAGVDLCRRADAEQTFALTVPLLVTASGQKMGKTVSGAAWLSAEKLSPNDFYQYWVNVDDADVMRFLRIYTLLPLTDLDQLTLKDAPTIKAAKHILAFEVTALIHGEHTAQKAHAAAKAAFGAVNLPLSLMPSSRIERARSLDEDAIPRFEMNSEKLASGLLLSEVLVALGWCKSNNEARRLLAQGGARLDDVSITDAQHVLEASPQTSKVLRVGKRRVVRLVAP